MMTTLTSADIDALNRAIKLMQECDDPASVEQIQWMLEHNDRREVCEFAAYSLQNKDLQLAPWESPPSLLEPDQIDGIIALGPTDRRYTAAVVAKQLLIFGLSLFEPQPRASIAKARVKIDGGPLSQ